MYFWLIVAALMLIVELVTLGNLISIWFVFGALGASLVAMISDSLLVQVFVFSLMSILSLLLVRPIAKSYLQTDAKATNADRVLNQCLQLTKSIEKDQWGQVRFNGVLWSCVSVDGSEIKEGEWVRVLGIEGVKLVVEKEKER